MDANAIIQAVSTIGFPIVACAALFWYIISESRATRQILEENTIVLTKVITLLSKWLGDEEDD